MKVLITGGAGFIGSNYVYCHLEQRPQDELFVLDALTYAGRRENLKPAEDRGVHFIQGRIEDRPFVNALFEREKFDLVVHFAAETHVDRSIENAEIFLVTNVLGTHVLLDAARDHGVQRFHHVSTDEVYGDFPLSSTEKFTEESPLKPSNPYAASKAASDLLVLSYHRTYGLPVSMSRCSNNYGPFQYEEKFIPLLISRAIKNEALPIYGKGENVRDWLFVEDHCKAILSILEKGAIGSVYSIGANNEQKNLDVAKLILKQLGKPESLLTFVEDRKGHDRRYSTDFSKLNHELGWAPQMSFEEGLDQTIAWYKTHHS